MTRRTRNLLVGGILVVLGAYVLYPLWTMLATSLSSSGGSRYLALLDPSNTSAWEAVGNSVLVSVASVVFSALVGTLFAIGLTQVPFRGRDTIARMAVLPIALPPLVGVIAFMFVFGESGFVPRLLQLAFGLSSVPFFLDGIPAIVAVHVYSFYVYFYLLLSNSLRRLDGSLIEAAAGLGSGPWRTFRSVVLPHLWPAYIGGAILTFMTSMASFSAPFLFGGSHRFMTVEIYSAKLNGDLAMASAQSVMLMGISLVFFLMLKFVPGQGGQRASKGVVRQGIIPLPRWMVGLVRLMVLAFFVVELLPILTIVIISSVREGSWTWQLFPSEFTLDGYMRLLRDSHAAEPIVNSVGLSLIALMLCLVIGIPAAYVIVKGGLKRRFATLLDTFVTFPYAVPGTIIAVSLILAFNMPTVFTGYAILVGTFWILPLAYAIRAYPMLVRSVAASLSEFDDTLLEASAASGARFRFAFRKIVLPTIAPGIVSGGILVVIASIGEFVSSILLYTYANRPISIEILSQLRSYNFGGAAAYSVILLLCIIAMMWCSSAIMKRAGQGSSGLQF